jgi:hypothetical protein
MKMSLKELALVRTLLLSVSLASWTLEDANVMADPFVSADRTLDRISPSLTYEPLFSADR